ncbi:MAG: response regulator [Hyphomicrobiaceae bacterium]
MMNPASNMDPVPAWKIGDAPGERLRILVVEDDFLIGMLLADMLEMMGHEVCATEATEAGAIAAAAKCHPNMMIIDAQLREGSGISAVDEILRVRAVPYIFVTGDIRGVLQMRPDAIVVEKPFTESCLISAMHRARARI